MLDEGYIKYQSRWTEAPAPDPASAHLLEQCRKPLFDAGLIGHYEDFDVGFGNISIRSEKPGRFLISGTQTGHLAITTEDHYSLVTLYDIERNSLCCSGPVQASSEAMTHAAIYELNPSIGAIVHVHSRTLWDEHLNRIPTTNPAVAYGTPEMAKEFQRLYSETKFNSLGIAVMGGHDEGLISYGESPLKAAAKILAL